MHDRTLVLPSYRQHPDLEGKVVLITGGSVGIGAAAALALGGNRCSVAVNYHRSREAAEDVARQIEGRGGQALLQGDVTDPATAPRVVDEAVNSGRLDVLINNAGDPITRVATSNYTDECINSLLVTCPRVLGPGIS